MRGQVVCEKDVKTVLTKLGNGLDQYHVLGLGNSNMNFNTTSAHESVTFFFSMYQRIQPYGLKCSWHSATDICW